jgi:hypothetical protein
LNCGLCAYMVVMRTIYADACVYDVVVRNAVYCLSVSLPLHRQRKLTAVT